MDLAAKLQLKRNEPIAVVASPPGFVLPDDVQSAPGPVAGHGPVLVFAATASDLERHSGVLLASALDDTLAWIAYPKAGALGTDLNRERVTSALRARGVSPVRQIAIDETWTALRVRPQPRETRRPLP